MGFSITRSQAIQIIVVLVALAFILSTISTWFSGSGAHQPPSVTPSTNESADVEAVVASGTVALKLDAYSPVIRIVAPSAAAKEYVSQLQANGTVTYVDWGSQQYATIALSDGAYAYDVGRQLRKLSPNSTVMLEVYVSSDREFSFTGANGTVRARIPRSKTTIMYPQKVGSEIPFKALVQVYDGQVIAGKLTPLAIEKDVTLPVIVNSLGDRYYARLFFSWHDRVAVNESIQDLVQLLEAAGAENVQTNFKRDDTVYLSRAVENEEGDKLEELLPGIKAIQMTRLVIYSNYSYTEEEVSDAVHAVMGNDTVVSFSMPMLELAFSSSSGDDEAIAQAFSNYTYKPLKQYVYRLANATTGDISVKVGKDEYYVEEMKPTVWVPLGSKEGSMQSLEFTADVLGENIVSVEQKLPEGR